MSDPVSVPPPKRSDAPAAARATRTATGTSPANSAAKAAADAKQAGSGKCAKHNLQAAPDGRCAICRREQSEAAQLSEPRSMSNAVFGAIAVIVIGAAIAWAVNSRGPVQHTPRSRGPTLAEQILVIDDQLAELRKAQAQGDLDPTG